MFLYFIKVSPSPSPDPAKTLNTTNTEDNSVSKVDNSTSLNNNNNNNNNIGNISDKINGERGVVGLNSTRGNEKESRDEKRDDETKNVSEEKDHRKPDLESEAGGENCTTVGGRRCTDLKSLTACILGFDNGNGFYYIMQCVSIFPGCLVPFFRVAMLGFFYGVEELMVDEHYLCCWL